MQNETIRLSIFGALLFFASLVQFLDIAFWGVVPNATLVVVVLATLFLRDSIHEIFIVACASFLLKFSPIANTEIIIFFIIGLLMMILARRLPWHIFVNGLFLIGGGTLAMYALVDPVSISSLMFVQELGYNGILMCVLYYGVTLLRPFQTVR